jgi:hypothetical protein
MNKKPYNNGRTKKIICLTNKMSLLSNCDIITAINKESFLFFVKKYTEYSSEEQINIEL